MCILIKIRSLVHTHHRMLPGGRERRMTRPPRGPSEARVVTTRVVRAPKEDTRTYEAFTKHTTDDHDAAGGGPGPHGLQLRDGCRDPGALRADPEDPPRPRRQVRRVPLPESHRLRAAEPHPHFRQL